MEPPRSWPARLLLRLPRSQPAAPTSSSTRRRRRSGASNDESSEPCDDGSASHATFVRHIRQPQRRDDSSLTRTRSPAPARARARRRGRCDRGSRNSQLACHERRRSMAPAFSAKQLASTPSDDWITNGGSTLQRPVLGARPDQDVERGAAERDLAHPSEESGIAAKYWARGSRSSKGRHLRDHRRDDLSPSCRRRPRKVYHARLNPKDHERLLRAGRARRRARRRSVYLGQLDGKLVALDQRSGKGRVAKTQVMPWQQGLHTITSAPHLLRRPRLHRHLGADNGIRRPRNPPTTPRRPRCSCASTPSPVPARSATTPAADGRRVENTAAHPSGRRRRSTPTSALLYFSTGNASPDFSGANRAGDNLFASSIVAIDAKTGTYRWHFQESSPRHLGLRRAQPSRALRRHGERKLVHGSAEPGKTGWDYCSTARPAKPLYASQRSRSRRAAGRGSTRRRRSRSPIAARSCPTQSPPPG